MVSLLPVGSSHRTYLYIVMYVIEAAVETGMPPALLW